ncbi:MAG TPA: hypothetical protein VFU29_08740, partial [Chitinophagaceae bacterium]|nr:hypothetical protein [Chitinophagaceae bacterium]
KFNSDISSPCSLITGVTKGIGYGIAEALTKRRYNLILIATHKNILLKAKNELEFPILFTPGL